MIYYKTSGEQFKVLKTGNGAAGEFMQPSLLKSFNQKLYVWCAGMHKLVLFDDQGNFLSEYKGTESGISDFYLQGDTIYYYTPGGDTGYWVNAFQLTTNKFVAHYGKDSNEQLLLDRNSKAGGFTQFNNELIAINSSRLELVVFGKTQLQPSIKQFKDKSFKVTPVNEDPFDLVNSDKRALLDYLFNNSYVKGIYSTKDYLVCAAEIGNLDFTDNNLDFSNRFVKYYLFSEALDLLKTIQIPADISINGLLSSDGDDLFRIYPYPREQEIIYRLEMIDLDLNLLE